LSCLVDVLELDLQKLWNNDTPEEDFLNLFLKISTLMLASPINCKSKPIKNCTITILASLSHRYNQSVNVASSLMEILYKYEHAAIPVAELLQYCAKDCNNEQIIGDFMR
jgi:hypothetical protein